MISNRYDAIVVGARCAGSPTAMLLARKGYEVLVLDRARFPSDTVSTHLMHPPGVASLRRWGLLERLVATGCPAIHTYGVDFGPFTIAVGPATDDTPVAYGHRRTVRDKLLVDAAAEAGAEVREGFTVTDVVIDGGRPGVRGHGSDGPTVTEHVRVVIGADGRHSLVARAVAPEQYHEKPPLLVGYSSYWSGLPMDGRFENYIRPDRAVGAWPTHDDLTLVIGGWPYAELQSGTTSRATSSTCCSWRRPSPSGSPPPPAKRASSAPQSRTTSASPSGRAGRWSAMPATTRTSSPPRACMTPSGTPSCAPPPWTRPSPVPAPLMPPWAPTRPPATSRSCPCTSSPPSSPPLEPPPELQQLLGAVHGNQQAMDEFARVMAGVLSPAEFFSEENVGRLLTMAY